MTDLTSSLTTTVAAILAIGGLGSAAFGLVDASKAFNGGVSNFGFGHVKKALEPFDAALRKVSPDWLETVRANWINGVPKEDQKATAKSLVRLGLCPENAAAMAVAARIDAASFLAVVTAIDTGGALTNADADLLGRFNGAIDASMDAGYERGDQQYRNSCRLFAGLVAVTLAVWAGGLLESGGAFKGHALALSAYWFSSDWWMAVIVGLIAVPIAPIAKDLASSLQAAARAVSSANP